MSEPDLFLLLVFIIFFISSLVSNLDDIGKKELTERAFSRTELDRPSSSSLLSGGVLIFISRPPAVALVGKKIQFSSFLQEFHSSSTFSCLCSRVRVVEVMIL